MPGYQFDVFISYSRRGGAPKWLLNHFYPKLRDCLTDEIAHPRIFVDKTMPRGVHWPSQLQKALRHSKIMISVLSAPYFTSSWCLAELRSMHEREKVLGLAGLDRPQGLIYPVLYSDSDNFRPEEGLERSWCSFKGLDTCEPVFQTSEMWVPFHQKVKEFTQDLVELLRQVPEWQPDWPLIEVPEPLLSPVPKMPRF